MLLATFSLRVGRPAASMAPPVWALALAMFGALTGHLVSRRWLWPAPGAAQPSPAPAPEPTSTPAETWQRDEAVEQGRGEERLRIAQDLHDDIGARLLTLMYKAPNDEIEEYIRHTLQDLKTLTRGLAAGNQRLSHAAAEWKADITQRLHPAGCSLHWSFSTDNAGALRKAALGGRGIVYVPRCLVYHDLMNGELVAFGPTAQVFTREQLEESLYGWTSDLGSNAIDVYVHNIRKKLYSDVIKTLRGVGYRIDPELAG